MLFFIIVSVLIVSANAKFYADCGSKLATVQSVSVSGCAEDAKECVLDGNTYVTFSIGFTPNQEVTGVEAVVNGAVMGVPVPFPLPQPDACKDSGLTCPLPAGQPAIYHSTVPIPKSYLPVNVHIKWELLNENDENLVCIMIPAEIN